MRSKVSVDDLLCFRDGVSDTQFNQVLDVELMQIVKVQ